MNGAWRSCLLAFGAIVLVGCGHSTTTEPLAAVRGVAVIDLDEVARQLGSDRQIAEVIQQRQDQLNQRLVELARGYADQLQKHRQPGGEKSSASPLELASYEQQANQNLSQAKNQARQDLVVQQSRLVRQFRDEIRPTARRIASERGLGLIVTKRESWLYDFPAEADITEAVIQSLREKNTPQQPAAFQPSSRAELAPAAAAQPAE